MLPASGSESYISLPRLGVPSVLCSVEDIALDGRPCRIDFPLLPEGRPGRVFFPRFTCYLDCEQALQKRLDELASCHFVGQSPEHSYPLGVLHYLAQSASAESVGSAPGEKLSAERCRELLNQGIGGSIPQLLRPYLFSNCSLVQADREMLIKDLTENPKNARNLRTRLSEIVFGDLSNTYEQLIHLFATRQQDITCTLRLRRIELIDNRLLWQFEVEDLSLTHP